MPTNHRARVSTRVPLALTIAGAALVPALVSTESEGAEAGERTQLRVSNAAPRRVFFDSGRKAAFDFELAGRAQEKRTVVVKAIHLASGEVKRRWRFERIGGKEPQRVSWNGKLAGRKGAWTGQGKHAFKVFEPGGRPADMSSSDGRKRFRYFKHRFPLPARHRYGDGLGAGRGHQGQDIFAPCGKPIVAARGGRVKHRRRHSGAGYYLVISGRATKRDYVYMHLQKRGRPKQGARVRTGQRIGFNGRTGNASACHLHFEIWSAPGWYEGGRPVNPTPPLRRWDGWS